MRAHLTPLAIAIGHDFANPDLLYRALTHSSFSAEHNMPSYERLEFLGDSVLAVSISSYLYEKFPDETEGDLSKRRSALVCGRTLSEVADSIGLGDYLQLSDNEEHNGGRDNPAILEDVTEAILGAVFLDGGYEAAKSVVDRLFIPLAEKYTAPPQDPKTALQEWSQQRGFPIPHYEVIEQTGPSHAPHFVIEVQVEGCDKVQGEGSSKREAQRSAAAALLEKLS